MTQAEIDALVAPHVANAVARCKTRLDATVASHSAGVARPFIAASLDVQPQTFSEHAAPDPQAARRIRLAEAPRTYAELVRTGKLVAYGSAGVRAEESRLAEAAQPAEQLWLDACQKLSYQLFGKPYAQLGYKEKSRVAQQAAQQNPELVPLHRPRRTESDPMHVNDQRDVVVRAQATLEAIARERGLNLDNYHERSQAMMILAARDPKAISAYGSGRRAMAAA